MRGNIETIKFTAVISAIFAFLSYFITLNMELAFFAPQWSWISNNFALTVCGGVFTSTLVVLFCEVQKYLSNKADCEQYLFYQTMYLYSLIFQMQKNIEEYIENKEESVPEGLLEKPAQMAQSQVNSPDLPSNLLFSALKNACCVTSSARCAFFTMVMT